MWKSFVVFVFGNVSGSPQSRHKGGEGSAGIHDEEISKRQGQTAAENQRGRTPAWSGEGPGRLAGGPGAALALLLRLSILPLQGNQLTTLATRD